MGTYSMEDYSRCVAPIELFGTKDNSAIRCGLATGFFFRRDDDWFLITNWHAVTGVDPTHMTPLDDDGVLPEKLAFQYKQTTDAAGKPVPASDAKALVNFRKEIDLYDDGRAIWFEHSTRQYVDVAVLKVSVAELGQFANLPVNEVEQTPTMQLTAGMDCFVLGYPEGMHGAGLTPIWKRGSVATEPLYSFDNKPAFLIDTATRNAMSGAPVVARHSGFLKLSSGPGISGDDLLGTMTKFCGIYSGRIGDDLMGVQLGVVWRADVLDDILSVKTTGRNPLRAPDARIIVHRRN